MHQQSSLLESVFVLFSDMLKLYIVYAIENGSSVLGVKVKKKSIIPLTFELGYHSQRILDLWILLPSMQEAMLATITVEQQVS